MAKTRATQQDVDAFIKAVCPEAPELYAAAFTEKKCLNDATEVINAQRAALEFYATATNYDQFGICHNDPPDCSCGMKHHHPDMGNVAREALK